MTPPCAIPGCDRNAKHLGMCYLHYRRQHEGREMLGPPRRGFQALSIEERRLVASSGGKAVAPTLRSFFRDRDLAASAGRLGGARSHGSRYRTNTGEE